MHMTLRVLLTAGALSAFLAGQEPQRRLTIGPLSPPDYMDNRAVDVARIAPERCTVEIDNYRMRVIRCRLAANSRIPIHGHRPGVMVAITPLHLHVSGPRGEDSQIQLPAGDIRWMDGGIHSEDNIGAASAEYLYVEAKN
jgi:hypothetical protein